MGSEGGWCTFLELERVAVGSADTRRRRDVGAGYRIQ